LQQDGIERSPSEGRDDQRTETSNGAVDCIAWDRSASSFYSRGRSRKTLTLQP
jgi:hypothetical protein